MFVILYRWRVKPQSESQFIESWSEITALYRNRFGSLGSRLHHGSDGLFYSYAQWRSAEDRESAFREILPSAASANMRGVIEESYPEILLETVADFFILPETPKTD